MRAGLLVLVGLVIVGWSLLPAQADGAESSPEFLCGINLAAAVQSLRTLQPVGGESATVGTPLTITSTAIPPAWITINIATTPAGLADPDIESNKAFERPIGRFGEASETWELWFSSTKATETPRTVYWDASLSSAAFPECAGREPVTLTGGVHTFTVTSASVSTAALLTAPPTSQTPVPTPVPLGVSLTGGAYLDHTHVAVSYTSGCSVLCEGETNYELLVTRYGRTVYRDSPKRRPRLVLILASGGTQGVTEDLGGRVLRRVKRAADHRGARLAIVVTVKLLSAEASVESQSVL